MKPKFELGQKVWILRETNTISLLCEAKIITIRVCYCEHPENEIDPNDFHFGYEYSGENPNNYSFRICERFVLETEKEALKIISAELENYYVVQKHKISERIRALKRNI